MTMKDFYTVTNSDYDGVMSRVGSEILLIKYLKMLTTDRTFPNFKIEFENREKDKVLMSLHTIKGMALNLGLTTVSTKAMEMRNALRNGVDFSELEAQYEEFCSDFESIVNKIPDIVLAN